MCQSLDGEETAYRAQEVVLPTRLKPCQLRGRVHLHVEHTTEMLLGVMVGVKANGHPKKSICIGPPLTRSNCDVSERVGLAVIDCQLKWLVLMLLDKCEQYLEDTLFCLDEIDECGVQS